MNSSKKEIAIIGMGISGIKTGLNLVQQAPHLVSSLTFFEKDSMLGGVLKSTNENGFLFEHGAQGVLNSRESFLECVQELNIEKEVLIPKNKLGTRYLIHENKCIALTPNLFSLLKHKLLDLKSLFRIFKAFFLKKPRSPKHNETLYDYVFHVFGKKIADNFCIPFCFGIWGGGAQKILCRFSFSNFKWPLRFSLKKKNKRAGLASFSQGMGYLPKTIFSQLEKVCEQNSISLNINYNSKIDKVHCIHNSYELNGKNFDIVVYAAQPWLEPNLNFGDTLTHKQALQTLNKTSTNSLIVVGIGGNKEIGFNYKNGFGALSNKISKDLLGILFIHSTYPEHTPENGFLYRVLFGGDFFENCRTLSDEDFLTRAKNHLKNLHLLCGNERITFEKVLRFQNYIPLSTQHQDSVLCALWQLEALNPGLFFAGNYISGVSVADCLEQAKITSTKVIQFILEQECHEINTSLENKPQKL